MNTKGHSIGCQYRDYSGPSCECDEENDFTSALTATGWIRRSSRSFVRPMSEVQGLLLSRLIDGWQIRWEKSLCTILEIRGYATPALALDALWEHTQHMVHGGYKAEQELAALKAAIRGLL